MLAHNYDQTLALSLMEMDAVGELEPHARFMAELEAKGRLDRAVEGLPDAAAIAERTAAGKGLTRPELAVLLAYGKLELKREIVASRRAGRPLLREPAGGLLPQGRCASTTTPMRRHRLRRDIIATVVANDIDQPLRPELPVAG